MASGSQLRLKFGTLNGERTWTYRYMPDELTSQQVNAVMDVMIQNGTIYETPPLSKVSAKLVITNEVEFDVSQ